jgi:SPP1 gp7 family putative phage head morphogenesis protein
MAVSKRKWLYPDTQEREYTRALIAYHNAYVSETKTQLARLPMRLDGFSEDIAKTIEFILLAAASAAKPLIYSLPDRFMAVSSFSKKQWVLQVKAGTGIDLTQPDIQKFQKTFGMGVNVWQSEPWLIPMRDNWVAANTSLIKNMPQQYLTQVDAVVRAGVSQGVGVKGLAKELERINGIDKRRAELIASDQIGKANAALTQHRQTDLGIEEYEWSSSNDSRVRPTHAAAEGKIFRWDTPPASTGGHPGHAVRCRCSALANFPD